MAAVVSLPIGRPRWTWPAMVAMSLHLVMWLLPGVSGSVALVVRHQLM